MNRPWIVPLIIVAILVVFAVCCAALLVGIGGWFMIDRQGLAATPSLAPQLIRPSVQETPVAILTDTLQTLDAATVPINDPIDLADRLKGKQNIPATLPPPQSYFQVGDQQSFWVGNTDTKENFQVQATLRYVTPHVYFWIENGVSYRPGELQNLAETFENKIYPTDREFFGSEWTPGVDGDPHLYILYAKGLGRSLAGYFSSADEYPPETNEYSNAHEMFLLNANYEDLADDYTYGVLAHEFQHMIHWYRDRNEETWMNEGFSDLAMLLNGYPIGGMDSIYVQNPDLQLTDWPAELSDTTPHYGAAFLFMTYFLDRFGEDMTKALVGEPANGMASIDDLLTQKQVTDPLSGKSIRADDVFADWVLASYLQDGDIADGRYTYHNYSRAPRPSETETVSSCPQGPATRSVHQYGVDYIQIRCSGDYTLSFEGSTQVNLLPANPHSGSYAFWSNQGDSSDMSLTRTFDFQDVSGSLTFSYWTWFDLEKDYDYLYLEASLDGKTWQILKTPSGTDENPSGNSYGWGYTGESSGDGGWIHESVDISQFAGKQVQLRFEYITDDGVNLNGFLLDDVSISQTGYFSDFEQDDGGWLGQGFIRIQNILPQSFDVSLISEGRQTRVERLTLSSDNTIEVPVHIGGDVQDIVLVVSGTTRYTRQQATYRFSLAP